jgi:outer membrane cobalamin receptor
MMDGIRISDSNSMLNMSYYNLTGVDRAEILIGPASTLYGADAHGGVVSLSSRVASGTGFSGHVLGSAGSLGEMRFGAQASFGWDTGWVQGTGDADQSPQSIKAKNPYRQSSGHVSFGQQLGENWLVTLNHRTSYMGAPTPFNSSYDEYWNATRYFDSEREDLTWQNITTASVKGYATKNLYFEANFGVISQENMQDANISSTRNPKFDRNQGNLKATWKNDFASATLLGDFISEELREAIYDPPGLISTGEHTAFALEATIEPLPVLRFVGSVRQQNDELKPDKDRKPQDDEDPLKKFDSSENQTTWKLGANLLLPSGFRAYASTGTSFNTASLYQINANLTEYKPAPGNERSSSILAGVAYEHNKRWWLRADASRISYSELLQWTYIYDPNPYVFRGYYENIYDVRVQGLELAGGMRGHNWDAELWARSQEGRKMDEPEERQLIAAFVRRPFFSCGVRMNAAMQGVNFGMNLSYIGHRYDYPVDASGTSANKTTYIDLSLRAGKQFGKYLTATLRADRLLQDGLSKEDWLLGKDKGENNVGYSEGFPSLGRSVSLELRYRF